MMSKKKWLSLLLAGVLTVSAGTAVFADTEDDIAYMQEVREEAQSELSQTQSNISSLEAKKQELEAYLSGLNARYDELTASVARLGDQAAEKEEELKKLRKKLRRARKKEKEQYSAMKLRIVYMYEKGQRSWLEQLLSSESLAQFLNQVDNVLQLSRYDREMLKKYEDLSREIADQESKAEEEVKEINGLMAEHAAAQQEVKELADFTSQDISAYIAEISASQEEARALMDQVTSADNSISVLMVKAAEEKAEQEAMEQEEQEAEAEGEDEDPGFDPETDTTDSSSSSTSSDVITEEYWEEETENGEGSEEDPYGASYEEESGGEEDYEEESSGDSQGTYLGTFTLTAYCNCAQCCGSAGNATASGTMPVAGRTVAMGGVPFGTKLLINGNVYTVEDLGTPYGHVDIFCSSHEEALSFGRQSAEVYQLN